MVLTVIILCLNFIMVILFAQKKGIKAIVYCWCLCEYVCSGCIECMMNLAVIQSFLLQLLGLICSIVLIIISLIYSKKSRAKLMSYF